MKTGDYIFDALGGVGGDLIDMAEKMTFAKSFWRRAAPVAACLAVLAGLGAAAYVWLPMQPSVVVQTAADAPRETVKASEPAAEAALPFYVLQARDGTDEPAVAVDSQGRVLVETDQGTIEPLVDQATGTYAAIVVRLPSDPQSDCPLLVYDLEGNFIDRVDAWEIGCLGDVVAVSGGDGGALYRRSDGSLLRDDLASAEVYGGCIGAVPKDGSAQCLLLDGEGSVTAQVPLDQTVEDFILDGGLYLCLRSADGRVGLMDSRGNWVLEQVYDEIRGVMNGYAICSLDGTDCAVDVETGETVFQWPWTIGSVFDGLAVVELESGRMEAVDWQGTPLTGEAGGIMAVDDTHDGTAELLVLETVEDGQRRFSFVHLDSSAQPEETLVEELPDGGPSSFAVLSSRTGVLFGAETVLLDLETGEERRLEKVYTDLVPLDGGLLRASYVDGGGRSCADLLQEDGTVLLEGLTDSSDGQGGVYEVLLEGRRALVRLDGTVLYQAEAE